MPRAGGAGWLMCHVKQDLTYERSADYLGFGVWDCSHPDREPLFVASIGHAPNGRICRSHKSASHGSKDSNLDGRSGRNIFKPLTSFAPALDCVLQERSNFKSSACFTLPCSVQREESHDPPPDISPLCSRVQRFATGRSGAPQGTISPSRSRSGDTHAWRA